MPVSKVRSALQSSLAMSLLIGNLVFLAVIGLRASGSLEFLELEVHDRFLDALPGSPGGAERIAIVGVTEEDIRRFSWPLSDERLAGVLERIAGAGASVIALDLYRDLPVPPGSDRLERVLESNPGIIAVMKFEDASSGGVPPPPVLAGTERVGFNDFPLDTDGNVRRALLFVDDGESFAVSFALRVALAYLAPRGIGAKPDPDTPRYLRLGDATIAPLEASDGGYADVDARGYQFLLDFAGPEGAFDQLSLSALVDGDGAALDRLRGRMVFVGVVAESAKDIFSAPISSGVLGGRFVHGVSLHAYAADQLVRMALGESAPVAVLGQLAEGAWIWCWTLLGAIVSLRMRHLAVLMLRFVLAMTLLGGLGYLALRVGWWVPVVPPAIGWMVAASLVIAYATVREKAERAQLMQLFSRHVSGDVAELLWAERGSFLAGGRPRPRRVVATVLFTDLKGFTTLSEHMAPQMLMEWLNEYMEAMADLVTCHGGIVDKFIGDAVMAVFGVPVPREDEEGVARDSRNAVECALRMAETLERLNVGWKARGLPRVGMRAGVFTGPLVAGSLGGSTRLEYTVIGDTVNTASRLESYGKVAGEDPLRSRILVGGRMLERLGEWFHMVRIGELRLKGKDELVAVYQVTGRIERGSVAQG